MHKDIIIIGAGAAGMMCGAVAGRASLNKSRKNVLILDHADKPGEKIRISGGGRCNFTNLYSGPENFMSDNPHFCKSALSRYSPRDFLDLVESYGIDWFEKEKGQLFCKTSSKDIIDMLLSECESAGNQLWLGTQINDVRVETNLADAALVETSDETSTSKNKYIITTDRQSISCDQLVIACGGASIPKMGASRLGYKLAEQFGLNVITPRPALVPLTFTDALKAPLKALSGVSLPATVCIQNPGTALKNSKEKTVCFTDDLLFTHRGLSGPVILQISSYWQDGQALSLDLAPGVDILAALKTARLERPRQTPKTFAATYLPQRLADYICAHLKYQRLADMGDKAIISLALQIKAWHVRPAGTEGFRTAEVTRSGVDTRALSSKTFETNAHPGLYFIGEVVDVTGHLGGHNFQWAWASAVACGRALQA